MLYWLALNKGPVSVNCLTKNRSTFQFVNSILCILIILILNQSISLLIEHIEKSKTLINPVRRSTFMWKFLTCPYSEQTSRRSSSWASSWILVKKIIQPSIAKPNTFHPNNTRAWSCSRNVKLFIASCTTLITLVFFSITWNVQSSSLLYRNMHNQFVLTNRKCCSIFSLYISWQIKTIYFHCVLNRLL